MATETGKANGGARSSSISLAARVYEVLKRDVIRGVYKAGEALSENELARRYSTSRTPVREAVARLEHENLLRIVPNKGYFVRLISAAELNNISEYRIVIECACAGIAATRDADQKLLAELKRATEVEYKPGDRRSYIRFIEADTKFHVGIAQLTRNEWLVEAVSHLRNQIERLLYAAIDVADYGPVLSREHRGILQAIRKRDAKLASDLMKEHIMGSKAKIFQLL